MDGWINRHALGLMIAMSAAFFLSTALRAWAKPFWHDEIFTLFVARLPTVGTMWKAQLDGLDLSPPLNTLVTRAVHAVVGVGRVTSRLPPMAGFWTASVILFVLVRRRAGAVAALAAAVLPCFTAGYRFAYEARSYGLTLGLAAVAFYAWLEAADDRHRTRNLVLMSAALAAGVWTHYFAVLAALPIVLGEIVRKTKMRRIDWPIWIAVAIAGLATVPLLPLASAGHAQAQTFWGRTAGASIIEMYAFLFLPVPDWGPLGGVLFLAAIGFGLAPLVTRRSLQPREAPMRTAVVLPSHELAAGFTFLALPIFGWLMGRVAGTGMAARYLVFTAIGLAFLAPIVISQRSRTAATSVLFTTLLLAGWLGQSVVDGRRILASGFRDPVQSRPWLAQRLAAPAPVVMTNGILFLQFWYYAPAAAKGRVTYLSDPSQALEYSGSDTIDRGLIALARWTPVNVRPYAAFTAAHREFEVYELGAGWLLDRLAAQGASIAPEGVEADARLDRVRLDGSR